jgi:hypothetical protein
MSEGWVSGQVAPGLSEFTFGLGMKFLFGDGIIYLLLYFYLDQVLPNEFGT